LKKIEELLKDSDVINVSRKAASSFRGVLSEEEIENCIQNAIWRASEKYKPDSEAKFTSFLHQGVRFECLGRARFNQTNTVPISKFEKTSKSLSNFDGFEKVDMLDEISKCEDPMLIYDRFYMGMTINELAKQHNVCGETIRIRLEKNLKKIKKSLTDG
jgi:DNA-directed RNA polymerase specialized sigma24 family protein